MRNGLLVAVLALAMAATTATALAQDGPQLAWSTDAVTVNRSAGDTATLTVVRSGDTTQEATAHVAGSEGFDGSVRVPAGAASATVVVALPDEIAPGGFAYYTLSDPSGATIGEPSVLAMTIYEDIEDPAPPPPDTTITRTKARVIAGTAAGTVARVEVSVLKREHGKCRRLRADGRLTRRGACRSLSFLPATGRKHWALRPRHRLPVGRYVVRARAVGADGVVDATPAKRTFTID